MPLFSKTQIQKFSPKTVKLASIYKQALNRKNLAPSDKIKIMKALQDSGYDYTAASKILSGKSLTIGQAKEVALGLSKSGIEGFDQDTNKLVNKYVRGEAIKRKNVAGRRRELMMESLQEDIYRAKTPGLKSKNLKTAPKIGGSNIKLKF